MQAAPSIVDELHKQLEDKDTKIAELRASNQKYANRLQYEKKKVERYMKENPSELDRLNQENTRLQSVINQLKRDRRDAMKYKKIYEIVTGEVVE